MVRSYRERQDQLVEERKDAFHPLTSVPSIGVRFLAVALYAVDLTESFRCATRFVAWRRSNAQVLSVGFCQA